MIQDKDMGTESIKLIANNKKAYHDYFIEEKYEAGIVLHGTEVKSVRMGKCSIKESFIRIDHNSELMIYGLHISPYEKGNIFNKDPLRPKKLLVHRKEINKLAMKKLPRGGYLATCSCSHFMPSSMFEKMLKEAAAEAAVSLRQIEARQQSPDHPILINVPETDYLKFYIFQVV